MKRKQSQFLCWVPVLLCLLLIGPGAALAAEPIIIGVPTSTGFLEGKEALKAVELAVTEINSAGDVTVGAEKRLFKVESIDIRDAAPGVPEALLGAIAMTPASEEKVKQDPEKYKYIFRLALNAKYLVKYLAGTMGFINAEYGFNKVYIMNQDVDWARKTAEIIGDVYFKKAGWTIVGQESYPTGTADFSSTLMMVKASGAQVILPIFDMPQNGGDSKNRGLRQKLIYNDVFLASSSLSTLRRILPVALLGTSVRNAIALGYL